MKKITAMITGLFLALSLFIGLSGNGIAAGNYVTDTAGLLSQAMIDNLNTVIAQSAAEDGADIIIYFEDNAAVTDSNIRARAEEICRNWTQSGGGYGENKETILFYVNMGNRAYFINEYNAAEDFLLSDADIANLEYAVEEQLSYGAYDSAAELFVTRVKKSLEPGFFQKFYSWILMGLAGGGICTGIAKGSHNTNVGVSSRYYMSAQPEITGNEEVFTGTRVVTRPIQTEQRTPGGGGGMSTGSGSSGNHGGGGHF